MWNHYPTTLPDKNTTFIMLVKDGSAVAHRDKLGKYHLTMPFPTKFDWTYVPDGYKHNFRSFDKK